MISDLQALLEPVITELHRQDVKWNADRTHPDGVWYWILGEELGEIGKALLEWQFKIPPPETDDVKKEVIHLIAVGIQWLNARRLIDLGIAQEEDYRSEVDTYDDPIRSV